MNDYLIENKEIKVLVSQHGAELLSLCRNGREYIWNGDAAFWNRHAPILFPAVGKPFNNEIRIDGKSFTMKQHGFARDCDFKALGDGRFLLSNDTPRDNYPYRFRLEVCYRLERTAVMAAWTVTNCDDRDMHFQIGAHPGFMLPDYNPADPVHGYVRFLDRMGNLLAPVMVSSLDDGNRVPLPRPVEVPSVMPVTNDSFAHDALIFEQGQVATTVLCDKSGSAFLSVSCPQAEAFGVWAPHKPGCPFVCLEPWCGICDPKGFADDIANRTYNHRLSPNESYHFDYTIAIL